MSLKNILEKRTDITFSPVLIVWIIVVNSVLLQCFCFAEKNSDQVKLINAISSLDKYSEYDAFLKISDGYLKSGEEATIDILIRYGAKYGRGKKAGDPIKNLQVVYDRIIEVFIVSEDFGHFSHLRAEDFGEITPAVKASGDFRIKHTFPSGGNYRVVVCFSHKGQIVYKHFDVKVQGEPKIEKDIDNEQFTAFATNNSQSENFDGYNVSLTIKRPPPVAKGKTELVYYIQDENGNNIEDLEVFMGTELHLMVWREDFTNFGYERTRPPEGKPGTVLLIPPIKTSIRYGTGILRETLENGKIVIEHGKVEGLLPAGKYPFKISDPEASTKVEEGDWVEFWVDNNPETGIVITRIEPLATMPTGDEKGVYQWAGNLPIYPGPDVPIEHIFSNPGNYVVFSQFKRENEDVVTTKFFVEVKSGSTKQDLIVKDVEGEDDKGLVKLSPQEKNGQMIYRSSMSSSGKAIYIKQEDGSKIDASLTGITCVGCHGEDGRGGQEGGVLTSDIRYMYLTKPYGVTHGSGRKHPPYNDDLIKRAITDGSDPAGNKLDPTMVRWEMSDADLNDLCAYIHRLSDMGRPGVTDDAIRIGCVLDLSGPLSSTGIDAKSMIEATFGRINSSGKIYGRSLKLITADGGNDPNRSLKAVQSLVEDENIFCVLGNLGDASTKGVIPFLEEKGIPVIAPLSPTYQSGSIVEQNTFFLFPTVEYQTKVMVDYIIRAKRKGSTRPKVSVVYSNDGFGKSGLNAAKDQLGMYNNKLVSEIGYDYNNLNVKEIAALLEKNSVEYVLILTPDARIFSIVAEADRLNVSPTYICNNMLLIKNIMKIPRASERFLLVQNFSFAGKSNPICAEFLEVIKDIPLNARNVMIQMAAFTGTKLLEEGLRLTGRDLTRKSLIDGMERLKINTGLFGIVSYKPGDHSGDSGVFLVRPDEATNNFVPVTKWMRPTQSGLMF